MKIWYLIQILILKICICMYLSQASYGFVNLKHFVKSKKNFKIKKFNFLGFFKQFENKPIKKSIMVNWYNVHCA